VLLAMQKAIENTKLNDRAMHYHFIALKQEWLGYVSYFTLYLVIVPSPTLCLKSLFSPPNYVQNG